MKSIFLCRRIGRRGDRENRSLGFNHSRASRQWEFSRIAKADLALLVSLYELKYRLDIPPVVIIDETLEISKEFSGENSRKFLNRILDKARSVCRDRPESPRSEDSLIFSNCEARNPICLSCLVKRVSPIEEIAGLLIRSKTFEIHVFKFIPFRKDCDGMGIRAGLFGALAKGKLLGRLGI